MTTEEKITYWIDLADYDLETAKAMLEAKRFLYVGFMCHQVIEKLLKAYWSKVLSEPPLKIHNLARLAAQTRLIEEMTEEQQHFIDLLAPMNIEARYPDYKSKLAETLSQKNCRSILNKTNALGLWIKEKLSK